MNIPQDTLEFSRHWMKKSMRYKLDNLGCCFDAFFTSYVIYNHLYSLICYHNKTDYPYDKEKDRAAKVARKFLGSTTIATDTEIRTSAVEIKRLIELGTFYIRDSAWDCARIEKLESKDPMQWSKGILEVVYKIRCNTFHGQKPFDERQRAILIPCIRILRRINELMIIKLSSNMDGSITP